MATTYTTNVQINKPTVADRYWDVPLNANADYLDGLAAIGGLAVTPTEKPSVSLTCRITAGTYLKADGSYGSFAGAVSLALGPNAISFVWLTDAGVAAVGPSYPSAPHVRLAEIHTDPSKVVQAIDARIVYQSVGDAAVFLFRSGDVMRGPLQVSSPTGGGTVLAVDPTAATLGFFGVVAATQAPRLNPLNDSTGGIVSDAISDVGSAFSQSALNNDLASLSAKVNALIAALKRHGLMAT